MSQKLSQNTINYLQAANCRLKLDISGIQKWIGKSDMLPIKDDKVRNIFEHILNLQVKLEKEEYVDFLRGITPVLEDLFEMAAKKYCGIQVENYLSVDRNGVRKWNQTKIAQDENLERAFRNYYGLDGVKGAISSANILPIIKELGTNEKIIRLSERLRSVEENVRNLAAHEIVSVTEQWIVSKSRGENANSILAMLKEYAMAVISRIRTEDWDSYNKMNQQLIDMVSKEL